MLSTQFRAYANRQIPKRIVSRQYMHATTRLYNRWALFYISKSARNQYDVKPNWTNELPKDSWFLFESQLIQVWK